MSPRTAIQNQEIREQSRGQILQAAFTCFAERGYSRTSIAQIATTANVSKGLVYNYFENKEALLVGILEHVLEEYDKLLADVDSDDPKDLLNRLIDLAFGFLENNNEHSRLFIMLSLQKDALTAIAPILDKIRDQKLHQLASLFKALGYKKAKEESLYFGAFLDGISLGAVVSNCNYPLAAMKERIKRQYKLL